MYQVRAIAVFPVFQLLTDFVCLLTYELCLSIWKIARCSVIWLLPLFPDQEQQSTVKTLSGMRQQDYGIHCQVRLEICPHLTSLNIIFQIGVVGKSVSAALVNFKLCCLMPE
jgi:hypothetical protein